MILHIIPDEKFTPRFSKMIEENFPNNHIYVVFGERIEFPFQCTCATFLKDRKNYLFSIKEELYHAELLVFHSLMNIHTILFLNNNKKLLNKSVFVAWGADIYNDIIVKTKTSFIGRAKRIAVRYVKKRVFSGFAKYMTFAYKDYDFIKKWYGARGANYDCLYPSTISKNELDSCSAPKTCDGVVRILVGNSGAVTNNHLEAFGVLGRFSEQPIEVVCPLSYGGEREYIERVLDCGFRIFGNKFHPITDYVNPKDYASILSSIDVAAFFHDRQQATGNIEILSYYGAKVFIKSSIATWEHYVTRDGCVFFDTLAIPDMEFGSFTDFSTSDKKKNQTYFAKIWDDEYIIGKWKAVLKPI